MVAIPALWLPILLSAIIVFIVSAFIHMGPLWHRDDFPKLANEAQFMESVRPLALIPGDYMVPHAGSMAEMRSAEFKDKMRRGPVVLMTVMPLGFRSINTNLVQWFIYTLAIGVLTAYIAGRALGPGAPYLRVFQVAGAAAFVSYAAALWPFSIWYRRRWSLTIKGTIDGLIYALLTAGTFGWLWPR